MVGCVDRVDRVGPLVRGGLAVLEAPRVAPKRGRTPRRPKARLRDRRGAPKGAPPRRGARAARARTIEAGPVRAVGSSRTVGPVGPARAVEPVGPTKAVRLVARPWVELRVRPAGGWVAVGSGPVRPMQADPVPGPVAANEAFAALLAAKPMGPAVASGVPSGGVKPPPAVPVGG